LADLDAYLELDLDASQKLDLKLADLVLNVLGNVSLRDHVAQIVRPLVLSKVTIGSHEVADLIVNVLDLSFT
jgi:hypothetical protein